MSKGKKIIIIIIDKYCGQCGKTFRKPFVKHCYEGGIVSPNLVPMSRNFNVSL